jgi:two-component system sensor histidine kinase PilS (NtrC family)
MAGADSRRSPLGASVQWDGSATARETREISRIWQGFMTARFTLGLVLVGLQGTLYATGTTQSQWLLGISLAYLSSTLTTGLFSNPRLLGSTFNRPWIGLVGVDVLVFSALQLLQGSTINYTPLFALPVLLASVLGSLQLALGTAAGVTVLLLAGTLLLHLTRAGDAAPYLIQAALSGVGYFAIALLANQLSSRLASEGLRARRNQAAANMQRQINALVIESLPDGVLIVDGRGEVRATNPAAVQLLGPRGQQMVDLRELAQEPAWAPLLELTRRSLGSGKAQEEDVDIRFEGQGPRRVRVRTSLTVTDEVGAEMLCVLFLQDLRAIEARMRTEKLASMGRMSTAVAHEIRNPLAAISQANALLEEDLQDPKQKTLTGMIGHNAERLAKIVDDILNASRILPNEGRLTPLTLSLSESVGRICAEWATQSGIGSRLGMYLDAHKVTVYFDGDHLHRLLVNLLDNARRYASHDPQSIVVTVSAQSGTAALSVWSNGAPMDHSVELHLFEPFFSSESRSSGLGLYICRELCESHGATISFQRVRCPRIDRPVEGNEFLVVMEQSGQNGTYDPLVTLTSPWQSAT